MFPELQWADGTLSLSLGVLNEGDTVARAVEASLWFAGHSVRGGVHPALPAGDTYEVDLALATPPAEPGRWPYRIAVDYTDATQHPFQALAMGTLIVGTPEPVDVALRKIRTLKLARRGALAFEVANEGQAPRDVEFDLHLPLGLEPAGPLPAVALGPGEARDVEIPLRNESALPGSSYAVFVVAAYREGGVHQALVVPASVQIVAFEPLLETWAPWLYGIATLLVATWGVGFAWQRLAGRT